MARSFTSETSYRIAPLISVIPKRCSALVWVPCYAQFPIMGSETVKTVPMSMRQAPQL